MHAVLQEDERLARQSAPPSVEMTASVGVLEEDT